MVSHKFVNYLKNERHYSSHTIKSYSDDLIQFFELLNLQDHDLSLVTANHIRSWIIVLKKKDFSAKTINRKIILEQRSTKDKRKVGLIPSKELIKSFENFFYDETRSLKDLFDERMED